MLRSFNTTGPCNPAHDYMLPAMARLPEVRGLIDRRKYFVLHAFALARGQPWLTNALAGVAVDDLVPGRAAPIRAEHIEQAKEILMLRQGTHFDSLAERLREPRVRAIVEPMIAGTSPAVLPPDDIRFATDLGLLRLSEMGGLEVANPIYREVIVRQLAASTGSPAGGS